MYLYPFLAATCYYTACIYKIKVPILIYSLLNSECIKDCINFKLIFNYMPQLVPFYFINQVTFAFILLVIMIYVFSKYILPRFVRLFLTRVFISKL